MRQLDLFGAVTENESPSENKNGDEAVLQKKALLKQEVLRAEETVIIEQHSILPQAEAASKEPSPAPEIAKPVAKEESTAVEKSGKKESHIVFSDGKIKVKIKAQPLQPEAIIKQPKEKKEKEKPHPQKRGRKSLKEADANADFINIPNDELLFKKQYYPIREVAGWFNVNPSLLRFWENEFEILQPRKNRKGDRLFRPEDVKNLELIYLLLRQKKYSVEGAKEYLKANKKEADKQLLLAQTLQKFRSFLLDLKANLGSA